MSRQSDSPRTLGDAAKEFEADISLAAMSLAPVLITAPPGDALRFVRAIAARERRGHLPGASMSKIRAGSTTRCDAAQARASAISGWPSDPPTKLPA